MDKYTTINEYFDSLSNENRRELQRIREIVHEEVPEATEAISYGMPAFKYKCKQLCFFAAFKDHLSFFPTASPVEQNKELLKDYKTTKGTIQFTPGKPLPDSLIVKLIRIRVLDIEST